MTSLSEKKNSHKKRKKRRCYQNTGKKKKVKEYKCHGPNLLQKPSKRKKPQKIKRRDGSNKHKPKELALQKRAQKPL